MKKSNSRLILGIIIALVVGLFLGKQFFAGTPQNNSVAAAQNIPQLPKNNSADAGFAQNNKKKFSNDKFRKRL